MKRVSLKCANCGYQDLEVEVNYFLPRAINLVCNKMGCGRVTPIAFFDDKGIAYGVNGEFTMQAYDDAFHEDVTKKQAQEAYKNDLKAKNF